MLEIAKVNKGSHDNKFKNKNRLKYMKQLKIKTVQNPQVQRVLNKFQFRNFRCKVYTYWVSLWVTKAWFEMKSITTQLNILCTKTLNDLPQISSMFFLSLLYFAIIILIFDVIDID